ncbi:hypothetical protein [Streptomyces cathayae]|uniref:Uncharacterized protein n=1 Tax=Streptomyces cathayae TaxID=3031124 RepID=A0ABY8JXJ6_9ACTN|nr:hypothetical protein [Streptomyces sp. HUAS 5]WGD38752.1 hypothetical protein PYS65_00385 [Streptomyces sp. HUAS 5]
MSGLGSRSLNIRNDSRRTVEVFRGATCDNGAPIATVGPHSSSNGVHPRHVEGGIFVRHRDLMPQGQDFNEGFQGGPRTGDGGTVGNGQGSRAVKRDV